ncbi:hypothetical protein DsansV1_C01g0006061 [Dioscorea sansibarensis]
MVTGHPFFKILNFLSFVLREYNKFLALIISSRLRLKGISPKMWIGSSTAVMESPRSSL